MKKKKILGIAIAAMISISSLVPAFADDASTQNVTNSVTTGQVSQNNKADKLAKLTQKASKLGIDITGLTNDQAKSKIRAAVAQKLGIDITGLSDKDASSKIKAALEAKSLANLTKKATKLGVDITGLSNKDARIKLNQAEASKLGIDVTGLSNEDVIAKIQSARAEKLGIDITGLSFKDAQAKIKAASEAKKEAHQNKNTSTTATTDTSVQ